MRIRSILILFIVLVLMVSINGINATSNDTVDVGRVSDSDNLISISGNENLINVEENNFQEDLQEINDNQKLNEYDDGYIIYVGHNNKTETGEGTEDNPFSSLKLAYENVNGQEKVTVKIFSGTYALGEGYTDATGAQLKFNTNNLNIVGYNGTVTIEPFFLDKAAKNKYFGESFGLTSTDGNCTFSNIIFDSSKKADGTYYFTRTDRSNWFEPFYGSANTVRYDNCSFIGLTGNKVLCSGDYSCQFINCYFDIDSTRKHIFAYPNGVLSNFKSLYFDYCYFNMPLTHQLGLTLQLPYDISINNSWFGRNSISNSFVATCYNPDQSINYEWMPTINRYAVFSVSENYLGNNQYNITGKLTWNGTDDQDGMENFPQMDVKLMSDTGDILTSVPLVNNTFSTIYTSSNSNHYITATLNYFSMELEEFNTVNLSVIAPSINYGDDQNITINFTQPITANITVTVSNESESKNYTVEVNNKNSINYILPDTLKAGTYTIEVKLSDKHLWGLNSTELTISKIDTYTFNPIVPSEAKVGDVVTIKVELPDDVTGNVIVYVNNKQTSKQASKNTEIDISDLIVVGNNNVTIFYEGNDKYENKTSEKQIIPIDKQDEYSFDVVVPSGVKVGDDANITIKLPSDVNGNALVYVGSQDPKTIVVSGNSTVVPVSGLVAGNNTVKVVFSDDKYAEQIVSKIITVEKVSEYAFDVVVPSGVKVGDDANITII